jgi:uncharacterized phage-associated protein
MIKFKFNERKALQAAGRLILNCGGEMNYMAMMKLLYIIDREALLRWGRPVTGDDVVAMKHGPVLSKILNRVSQKKQGLPKSEWHKAIPRPRSLVYTVKFQGQPDVSALSQAEIDLIDEVFARCKSMAPHELVELTHELPEWHDPGDTSVPIPFENILKASKKSDEQISAIAKEAQADDFLDRALASV